MNAPININRNTEVNVMDHLGEEVVINGITYNLPTAEELSCADLKSGWSVSESVKDQLAVGGQ